MGVGNSEIYRHVNRSRPTLPLSSRGAWRSSLYWRHRRGRSRGAPAPSLEHVLAKGDRLSPSGEGRCLLGAELAKRGSNFLVRPAHLGRSRPPGAGARFGEGSQPAQRLSPLAEYLWTGYASFFPRLGQFYCVIALRVVAAL